VKDVEGGTERHDWSSQSYGKKIAVEDVASAGGEGPVWWSQSCRGLQVDVENVGLRVRRLIGPSQS
jgi:hypothetical protein